MPASAKADLDGELNELYGVPLAEFTAARNDLAKRLKAEGRAEEADEVKALRKPTVAVWLANTLARERELDVQRLRKAGEALAQGQAGAASGGSSDAFVEARKEEQHALSRLGDAARELARREGASGTAADRALATLRAASLTEEGRELLRTGRFTEELELPGFEALAGLVTPVKKSAAPKDDKAARRKALSEARERLKELRAEERELDAAARDAEREAAKLRRQAEQASERVAEAEADLEKLDG